jgi:hypothetical protein
MRSVRNTERVYKNRTATRVQGIEAEHPGDFSKIHELVKGENYRKSFQETGALVRLPLVLGVSFSTPY